MADIQHILEMHREFTLVRGWDKYQTPKNLSMALSVEAAELVEVFMWAGDEIDEKMRQAAGEEIADVFIYLVRIADELGIDLMEATRAKMKKNFEKHPVNV